MSNLYNEYLNLDLEETSKLFPVREEAWDLEGWEVPPSDYQKRREKEEEKEEEEEFRRELLRGAENRTVIRIE